MNICQVSPYFPYREHIAGTKVESGYHIGGVEKHVYLISKHLSERGHNVSIITTRSPIHKSLNEPDGLDVVRLPMDLRIYNSNLTILNFMKLDLSRYDIIHAHTPVPAMADIAALKNIRNEIPFVLTYHNDIYKDGIFGSVVSFAYMNTLGKSLLNKSDFVISTTKSYASNSRTLSNYMQKVKVIPNGVNEIFFNPDLDGMIIKNKYGLKDDCKVVLFVGRLDYYKGCDYLIRAFSKVLWSVSNSHLIMVGGGPLKEKLKEIASCLKISENISFAGHVKDELLPYYYAACDVFVLPSISSYEGFGMVQLEAMACAKPVITTTLPGVSEIDADEVATLHVPPKDEDLLARSLIKILQNDELAINLGRNGRKLIIDKYSWSKVIVALEELYFKLTVGRVNANLSIRRMQR